MSGNDNGDFGWKGFLVMIVATLALLGIAFSNQIAEWLGRVLP